MRRLTISVDDDLADAFEALVLERGYESRSEAYRDLLRREIGEMQAASTPAARCVATLTFLYDHHERKLATRLTDMQHEHHEITVSSLHAHLDHDNCIETIVLRGRVREVRAFADAVMAERGVHHGKLHLVPLSMVGNDRQSGKRHAAHEQAKKSPGKAKAKGHSHADGHGHGHVHTDAD